MKITELILDGIRFFFLGAIIAAIVRVILAIVLKRKNKDKKYILKKIFFIALFICYLCTVFGITIMERWGVMGIGRIMPLFSSYREAWNSFSIIDWRNILLNIAMFVPFGIIFPNIFDRPQKLIPAYLTSFIVTLAIETIQLVFGRGIFEMDDILNNTLGAMVGYGIYTIARGIIKKDKKKRYIVLAQIPLLIILVSYAGIFGTYHFKELGNLEEQYSYRYNMKDVDVVCNIKLDGKQNEMAVYQSKIGNIEDTLKVANKIFEAEGTKVDSSQNDVYDETAVYYSENRHSSVWVNYKGLTVQYSNFDLLGSEAKKGCNEEEVRRALKKLNVELPQEAEFSTTQTGEYLFEVDMLEKDNQLTNGTFRCSMADNGIISDYQDGILVCKQYKNKKIISEKEAISRLKQGKFDAGYIQYKKIVIESIEISYSIDSKGFYQPIYEIKCKTDDSEEVSTIIIPALQ